MVLTFKVEAQGTDVGRLRRDVTEYWMDLTHEAYRKRAGSRIGTSIPGIFADEPTVPLIVQAGRGGRRGLRAPTPQTAPAAPALQGSTAWLALFGERRLPLYAPPPALGLRSDRIEGPSTWPRPADGS